MKSLRVLLPGVAALMVLGAHSASAQTYNYDGEVTVCTSTCDSFASLSAPINEEGTTVIGSIDIDVDASSAFDAEDITDFAFIITSSLAPAEDAVFGPDAAFPNCDAGKLCNPTTANPLPLDPTVAAVRDENTAGTEVTSGVTDASGELASGQILIEFTAAPFSGNGAWVILDVGTGFGQVCLFFDVSGCISGGTETVNIEGAFSLAGAAPDSDGDGVTDDVDNCTLVANSDQRDTNDDGIGNICDADLSNNCVVSFEDLGIMKSVFFTPDPDADLNGNGSVSFDDLGLLKSVFFGPPGPSAAGCN